jgi:hypothetical protein
LFCLGILHREYSSLLLMMFLINISGLKILFYGKSLFYQED